MGGTKAKPTLPWEDAGVQACLLTDAEKRAYLDRCVDWLLARDCPPLSPSFLRTEADTAAPSPALEDCLGMGGEEAHRHGGRLTCAFCGQAASKAFGVNPFTSKHLAAACASCGPSARSPASPN